MTAKKAPNVGDRVIVFEIDSVQWPSKDKKDDPGVTGTVTLVEAEGSEAAWRNFWFLPDLPDKTENDVMMTAREHSRAMGQPEGEELGWLVYVRQKWRKAQYIINELDIM